MAFQSATSCPYAHLRGSSNVSSLQYPWHSAPLTKATFHANRTCQHRYAGPRLPVPDANGLVIAGTHDPGVLLVELHCPDVVQVPQQREKTPPAPPQA